MDLLRTGRRHVWITHYVPLFVWIGMILFLGSGQGSMTRTSLIIRPLLEFLFPMADEATLQLYHGYIRKFAHFAEYAVLAIFALRAFAGVRDSRFVSSIILVAAVASIDELMQTFIVARTGSGWDILLDVSGGLFIIVAYYFWQLRNTSH